MYEMCSSTKCRAMWYDTMQARIKSSESLLKSSGIGVVTVFYVDEGANPCALCWLVKC